MKKLDMISDLKDKKVLLRTDFDVPLLRQGYEGQAVISEMFRIKKQKETIDYLLDKGASVMMIAHITSVDSFATLFPQLEEILGHKTAFSKNLESSLKNLESNNLVLLENIRQFKGEKENSDEFAEHLSKGFDLYINNAFAVCHRNHASVSSITNHLPAYAGLLIEEETAELEKAVSAPKEGKIVIIGGAKAETKVPVIKNFIDKAEAVIVGGVVANDILKEKGVDIGKSLADENTKKLLAGLDLKDPRLVIPDDFNIFENKFLDIGTKSIDRFKNLIDSAKMVIWNGPMGMFEDERFSAGTYAIAKAIAGSDAFSVVGGGDSIAAINNLGIIDKFDFVSTGGGAMLEFLAGNKLPGLEVLGYYE